ncbi:ABC transporter permease [Pseudemcibacter aquimaris]|uniref:ABC transporter permease n=1 Tax=Pseudemcibacter aquimaris TaxID=2857064 RepID=UPI0020119623|nr:ABC transporter permease [Pseudemcibacter aquimaris]MCC3859908.1 ABC transporter permease [Pseudemcibacter aquimaris]WDU57240.1 ABC transporter permease [Pseudemcibacter aquimaris]
MLLTNYFKSAYRNLLGHKLFSLINIMGLAIGLAAVMLITLFVRDELSYDTFWANADNIYRPQFEATVPGMETVNFVMMPAIMRDSFMKDFPQVTHAARLMRRTPNIKFGNTYFQDNFILTDKEIIDIFDFNVVAGSLDNALTKTTDVIINETLAEKYFGNDNPIGKIIPADFELYERDYEVVAVIEDTPENSMVDFQMIGLVNPDDWTETQTFTNWISLSNQFYFSVTDGTDISVINDQLPAFVERNFIALQNVKDKKISEMIFLEAVNIKDIHLKATGVGEWKPKGNMTMVIIFASVSVLILIIAAINFMNLSTARASLRAKEVSLRKVLGASRKNLIIQFLGESLMITFIALFIALLVVEVSLPTYNEIINKSLDINYISVDILELLGFAVLIGLTAGVYPAFFLSNFRPAHILRANKSSESKASSSLRSILVIFQFTISITLFVSTAVVYGQMQYAKNIEFGYDEENMLMVYGGWRDEVSQKRELLITEFERLPNVTSVTTSFLRPGREGANITGYRTADMDVNDSTVINNTMIGYGFFETYGVKLLAGREYNQDRPDAIADDDDIKNGASAHGAVMINEAGLGRYGFSSPEEAVGEYLYQDIGDDGNFQREFEIIGVIPNVYFDSLKYEIKPEVFQLSVERFGTFSIRFTGDPVSIVDDVRNIWNQELQTVEFEYEHVIDSLAGQYEKEEGEMTMFATFSGLAIFIACLGLFGLASFTAERRTKEIGIRKVMGASDIQIVKMLIFQFSKPVIIANIIAWPVAYLAMSRWLESFVYRIDDMIIIALCLFAGLTALLIAWATVAGNSYSVAKENPIKALRYE